MAESFSHPDQVEAYAAMNPAAKALVDAALAFARVPGVTDIRETDDPETATAFQALASIVPALGNEAHARNFPPHMFVAAFASGLAQIFWQTQDPRGTLEYFAEAMSDAMNQVAELWEKETSGAAN